MKKWSVIPVLLLALAFVLQGAKTPMAFCLWSVAALAFSWARFRQAAVSRLAMFCFLSAVAGVLIAQVYSLDPSASLFWSLEYLVLACLWLALVEMPPDRNPESFWASLAALSFITCVLTSLQYLRREPVSGAFPLNPNFNAVWMAALASALSAKRRQSRLDLALIAWMSAMVLFFGHSRSGLLALTTGIAVSLSARYSARRVVTGLAVLAVVAALIPHGWLMNRMILLEDGERLHIWRLALRAMMDYPLTGYGPGNFEIAYQRHAFAVNAAVHFGHTTAFAHNDILQAAVELGCPLASLLACGYGALLLMPPPANRPLAGPARSLLAALGIAACFNPIFKMPVLAYLAILAASCLWPERPAIGRYPVFCMVSLLIPPGLLLVAFWCGLRAHWADRRQWARIVAINPHDAEAWHQWAYSLSEYPRRLAAQDRAVQESPDQIYYVEALARTLESIPGEQSVPSAIKTYLKAISLAPTRATDYLGIARLLWRAGEPREAMGWIDRAQSLEPNYWECDLWKARCFGRLGEKNHARFLLEDAIRRHAQFLQTALTTHSPYEQAILGYDEGVILHELTRLARTRSALKSVE